MIANMSAFALARHWRHTSVYDALLEQDGSSRIVSAAAEPTSRQPADDLTIDASV